jgi:hypothetical protein
MNWNDRRKSPKFNNPSVEAAAKAGSIKATPKNETEKVFKVNRPMTNLFHGKQGYAIVGKEVTVKKGSKKAERLKSRLNEYGGK